MSVLFGVRTLSALNVLFGVSGLFLLVVSFRFDSAGAGDLRFLEEAYYARVAVNLVSLSALLLASVSLWRLAPQALLYSNVVYSVELIYLLGGAALPVALLLARNETANNIGRALGATAGSGDMGLAPQFLTGYPFIAIIVLNILYRRHRRAA